jgi:hypothetical protein
MDFTYDSYRELLDVFLQADYRVATVRQAATELIDPPLLILRHDVEWSAERAVALAAIERGLDVRSTLYFRVDTRANDIRAMMRLQDDGFDIGYHYNCLDRTKGDVSQAIQLFEQDMAYLRHSGIEIVTVAPHGNPRLKRVGYESNADLIRRDPTLLNRMDLWDLGGFTRHFDRHPNLFPVADAGVRWNHGQLTRKSLSSLARDGSAPRMFMLVHTDYWSGSWPRPIALHVAAFGLRAFRLNAAIASARHASQRAMSMDRGKPSSGY